MTWRQKLRDDMFRGKNLVQTIDEDEEDDEEVAVGLAGEAPPEIDDEQTEEAQKLKRKKRKIAKEKKKLEEKLNLKMVFQNDQLIEEEHELFSLKSLARASKMSVNDEDVNLVNEDETENDGSVRPNKVLIDKDSDSKYYDPDDSDVENDDDDDENEAELEMEENDEVDDNDEQNELLVDIGDKQEKVKNLTKMFFDNKIFNQGEDNDEDEPMKTIDFDSDDDIELEELENRLSIVKKKQISNGNASNGNLLVPNGSTNKSVEEKLAMMEDDEEDDDDDTSSDEEDEQTRKNKQKVKNNVKLSTDELALGAMMIKSKKSRRDLVDNGWNRYVHEDDDHLPSWFRKEEQVYYRNNLPVSAEMMKEYSDKLRALNSKPIKKVMEAKARKKKRAIRRLEKARTKAEAVTDNADMSNKEKAEHIKG